MTRLPVCLQSEKPFCDINTSRKSISVTHEAKYEMHTIRPCSVVLRGHPFPQKVV